VTAHAQTLTHLTMLARSASWVVQGCFSEDHHARPDSRSVSSRLTLSMMPTASRGFQKALLAPTPTLASICS
jgi:hypothetical protein